MQTSQGERRGFFLALSPLSFLPAQVLTHQLCLWDGTTPLARLWPVEGMKSLLSPHGSVRWDFSEFRHFNVFQDNLFTGGVGGLSGPLSASRCPQVDPLLAYSSG